MQWDPLLDGGLAFDQAGVPSCSPVSDDVTHRSCANFKCDVADVNKHIRIDFGAVKCVSAEYDQPCRENFSLYIQPDHLVEQDFN